MTDKEFITQLLKGAYIIKRPCGRKGYNNALYKGNMELIACISDTRMQKYSFQFKHSKNRTTLNLNLVRMRHGNSLTKSLYKKLKKNLLHDNAQNINGTGLPKRRLRSLQHDERQQSLNF